MTSRKKARKNNKIKSKNEDTEKTIKCNPHAFFTADEITHIKSVLKIKEVQTIPIAMGCAILGKAEILEKALCAGVDINELGPNNTTALIWAIRHKNLELVKFLLENGADPTIRVDNGENVIIIALEHKLWDEATFMELWHMVSKVCEIEVDATNKNGHTILHIAVRREWERFIATLLAAKVQIDITNINGVTPLMTACFRNNFNIVNILINHGADFTKEDNHYRTALCYAIVTGAKASKPPHLISERIIFELKKDLSFKEYIKRRIEIIDLIVNKEKVSDSEAEMLVTLIHYIVQYTENGLKLILEFKVFEILQKALKKANNDDKEKLLLQIALELVCYNEQVIGFNFEVQLKLTNEFFSTSIPSVCLERVKTKEKHFNLAFYIVLIICTLNDVGQKWIKDNYASFKEAIKVLPGDFSNNFQKDFGEENRLKLMKKKMKKLRRCICLAEGTAKEPPKDIRIPTEKKSEPFFSIKKSKRRTKVMKAKITKIKNMEITERLSMKNSTATNTKDEESEIVVIPKELTPDDKPLKNKLKEYNNENENKSEEEIKPVASVIDDCQPQDQLAPDLDNSMSMFNIQLAREIHANDEMVKTFMTDDIFCPAYINNESSDPDPITNSLKQFLENQRRSAEKQDVCHVPTFPEWKSKICRLSFNDWSLFGEKMKIDKRKLQAAMQYMKRISTNCDNTANAVTLDAALDVAVAYLKELIDIIISRIKAWWDLNHDSKLRKNERQALSELQANFHHLISSICSLAHTNLSEALKNIYQLESTLLHFPINGKTLLPDVCALENVKVRYTTFSPEANASFLSYVENVLNGIEDSKEDIRISILDTLPSVMESEPPGLFEKEISSLSPLKPRNKKLELEAMCKTMKGAYHLESSIENLIKDEQDIKPSSEVPLFRNRENSAKGPSDEETKYSEMILKILTKHVEKETYVESGSKSRWAEKLQQLQDVKFSQTFLGGDVRLCKYPERNHVISQGGNFNFVTLGLGTNDQPLAIKRIPSEHCVCTTLKELINPLLGLRNKHILHYFICDYDENDLILATPLCEYNIGQYVLLLNENSDNNIFHLTHMEIVRQFLNGLAFLHQRPEPIVHGNLKPSNIFVDINGVVRLAEFGINKALFKLIEAPKTSLIWFSQEMYRRYKSTLLIESTATLCSDIQVAGMLIYFIVSGGEHPFGTDMTTILKNLEKPTFTLSAARDAKNQIFGDLVSWMLMYEPNDRPHIKQILSHVLFWSNERRWRFILNCSGISTNGVPIAVNMTELHNVIEEAAAKEQIKGHWVNVTRRKFPKIKFQGDDTVVGFLKFIKQFYESQGLVNEENMHELRSCVLSYFPAFPLTLFRIMESTGMIKEYPFIAYTVAENIVS